jgi:DNA polymerase-3 subunit gamma/tau
MALNCENKQENGEPCGKCISCQRIWAGSSSLDVVEIDAASNRGVDDARELRERAMYAPTGDDRYKVYIVDEAHMLTREAWNALLKILEEPPPRVVFVFATTEPQKIAQTAAPVLSRLQRFDLKRIGAGDITVRLKQVLAEEGIEAAPDALAMLARAADGSMRDALSLTDQVLSVGAGTLTASRVRDALGLVAEDEFLNVLRVIAERRAGDVFSVVAKLADAGVDFGVFLNGLADMLRAQLAISLGGNAEGVSPTAAEVLAANSDDFTSGDLLRMLTSIAELEPRFRKSGQQQMLVEMLLVRFALIDRTVSIEEVLRNIGGSGSGGSEAPSREQRPPAARPPAESPAKSRFMTDVEQPSTLRVSQPDDIAPAAAKAAPPKTSPAKNSSLNDIKKAMEETANDESRTRLSAEALRAEKIAALRARDPVLSAAIDELDLELLD